MLTGDSLFVGDVARPDLAVDAREGAEDLFHSLRRLLELEDGVETYPGHVAGSLCGKGMSSKGSTTIGFERRFNTALAADDVAAFVAGSAAVTAPKPPNVERIVELNRGPFVGAQPFPEDLDEAPDGMQVLDVRSVEDFAAGHQPGAVCVPVSGTRFSTKAGFAIHLERPVVVAATSDDEAAHAVEGPPGDRRVRHRRPRGRQPGRRRSSSLSVEELDALLDDGAELIDVREKDERADGYIAGSRNIPYRLLTLSEDDLPRDRPRVTICETGPRAAIAASILAAHGFDAHPVVDGGIDQWIDAGKPTVTFRRCGC